MIDEWRTAGWPIARIRDIGRLHGGGTPSRKRPEYFQGTIPWITGQDISDTHVAEICSARDYVTEDAVRESATRVAPAGSVLVTTRVSVGKTAVAGCPICFSQDVTAIIIHSAAIALPTYVAYFLQSRRSSLLQKNQGSTIAGITRNSLALEHIPLPPLSEQQRIVEVLQEAEAIRALRATAEAKTTKLAPALFEAFFGDPAKNSKKWRTEPLGLVVKGTPKNGLYKPSEAYGDGTPIIRIGDFADGIIRTSKNLQRLRISDDEIEQFGLSDGQILINRVNSIEHLGKSLLIRSLTEATVYESNMMRLEPVTDKVLPEFLVSCLQHASMVAKLRAKAKKAINQASINQTDVLTLSIPVPPLSDQKLFISQLAQCEEIRVLAQASRSVELHVSASLTAQAFSGQLTADWREAHAEALTTEAHERDAALKQGGATLTRSRRAATQIDEGIEEQRSEGINADLNREQRGLLFHILENVGGVRHLRYFTADSLSRSLKGPLRRNPQAIEGHLAVFAVRGLVIPVSLEEQTKDTGEFVFGNAYRLALRDVSGLLADEAGNILITENGDALDADGLTSDHARGRELERLVAQIEKERGLS